MVPCRIPGPSSRPREYDSAKEAEHPSEHLLMQLEKARQTQGLWTPLALGFCEVLHFNVQVRGMIWKHNCTLPELLGKAVMLGREAKNAACNRMRSGSAVLTSSPPEHWGLSSQGFQVLLNAPIHRSVTSDSHWLIYKPLLPLLHHLRSLV